MPSCPCPEAGADRRSFSSRLLAWWDLHGRKDLPWQNPRDPYRIWVSEIMLQQTQVAAVIPYFERWMERFPDLPALAAASQDDVLSLWSGLGYYARARNLHKAAKACVERFDGALPNDPESLRDLPGIGPSTANAIVSLACNRPAAILDGNVKRVMARHAAVEGWPGESAIHRTLWREAERRLPEKRGADYSQAVMDLGALVCKRRKPDCAACPVAEDCVARTRGLVDAIPAPRPKKDVPARILHMLIIRDSDGRVLLQRRPPDGIWGGLWSLPEGNSRETARESAGLNGDVQDKLFRDLPELEHRLTHLRLHIRPALVTLPPGSAIECSNVRENSDTAWASAHEREQLGLPRPVDTLLKNLP